MTKSVLMLVGFLLAFGYPSGAQPKDVTGWNKIQWGMSVDIARTILGKDESESTAEQQQSSTITVRLAINDLKLDDRVTATVLIKTRENSTAICEVTIQAGKFEDSESDRSYAFSRLRSLLITKYGSPKTHTSTELMWTFPSTTI